MNQGTFWIRTGSGEGGAPLFSLVHGYVQKKDGIRIGIYRVTNAGLSSYKAVDLRDGWEISDGLTIHDVIRSAHPLPTAALSEDPVYSEAYRALWNHAVLLFPERNVTLPSY